MTLLCSVRFAGGALPGTLAVWIAMGMGWLVWSQSPVWASDQTGRELFEKKIRPVLAQYCYECHSAAAQQAGKLKASLLLDTRERLRQGGTSGPAVVPGNVKQSLLVEAIRYQALEMPPNKKLPEAVIADFVKWIEMGAPDPRELPADPQSLATETWQAILPSRRDWWSLRPVKNPPLPSMNGASGSESPIDQFILAKLAEAGIRQAAPTDRYALIRRLSFVLTGLPPSPREIETFVNDGSPTAYPKLVDRLLASPHLGQRWARHWMDVVRFGETHGHEWNLEVRGAWRYRDYLIRAFNNDVPYDQLLREHIAGDLLHPPRINRDEQINESVIGTAFYRFGEVDHDDCRRFKENNLDVINNQIDTLSKAFQAMTVSCARCHDHKLDAVSMADYYALSGVLASSRQVIHTIDVDTGDDNRRNQQLKQQKRKIQQRLADLWREQINDVGAYLRAAQARHGEEPAADAFARGLEPERLSRWVTALQKAAASAQQDGSDKLALKHVMYPWITMVRRTAGEHDDISAAWNQLADLYRTQQRERAKFNATNFVLFADFRQRGETEWDMDGLGLTDAHCHSGEFAVDCVGDRVVKHVMPAGLATHRLSSRLNGSLRSPLLPKNKKYVSLHVWGGGGSALRSIYDNCPIFYEASQNLDWSELRWVTASTAADEPDVPAFVELVTRFDSQGFPKLNTRQRVDASDIRSYFGVTRVVLHDSRQPPQDELDHMLRLFDDSPPTSWDSMANRYRAVLRDSVLAWAHRRATDADIPWINWLLRNGLLTNSASASGRLGELLEQYRDLERQIQAPKLVVGMADFRDGFDVCLRLGGAANALGPVVRRGYLEVFAERQTGSPLRGSGRRELAETIASPLNPLTARVMVNRVWHHVFGTGIVKTTDDFGRLGELPSHPKLLDYLASRFVEEGWSVKKLIRALVLTKTFRMSSQPTAVARQLDPRNRLLHHYSLRRLEGEAIRDSILFVSGRLDHALYGPSIHPYRVNERPDRRLFCGPLDGRGRRSIYTKITLTEEPPFLAVFNLPDPKHTRGRRDVTNVPAQALTLLNDPFVIQQADCWATRLMAEADLGVAGRIQRMFFTALGRYPASHETARFEAAVDKLASLHQVAPQDVLRSKQVWNDVAHAFYNLKEFIYVR